jgi:hypothetical protein
MKREALSSPHTSALVARTCYSWQVGSTKFPRVRATFTAFSSFVTCKPNIKHVWYFSSFVLRANDKRTWIGKFAHACNLQN